MASEIFDSEARLSWVLAALAGVLGATAFTHSAGYFVTFMTGNAQRAVLGVFRHDVLLSITAGLLLLCFVAGVVIASVCRRHFWVAHPHGPTVLTTLSLFAATVLDVLDEGWEENLVDFAPIMLVVFAIGALNTSFVKDGEVSVPLSYVTGTLVKMGQGIERHIAGGNAADWLGYFLLFASFCLGATLGGWISLVVNGTGMLVAATAICALTTGYTYFHQDRRALLKNRSDKKQRQQR
ncbi:MAG TPA: YoaK family protein [Mycobacterium sp.]|nr:YoaK family protein [Mycobacterium sp.]HUH71444.1 YoaK family protein [Mycobacterium sp.]